MRRFYFIISGLFLLSGCSLFDQSGTTTVEGLVVDKDTGWPVPLAEVQVHAFSGGGGSGGGGYGPSLGGPYLANAQGYFSFSFEARKNTSYNIDAYGPLGHVSPGNGEEIKSGRKNRNVRVPVQAPAWVRIKLIDEPPRANSGRIGVGGFQDSYSAGLPLPRDTSFYRYFPAHISGRVSWVIEDHRQSTKVEAYRDLTIGSLDTVTVEVRF